MQGTDGAQGNRGERGAGKNTAKRRHILHVLALLSFQQPTSQKITWNQPGIDLQMPRYT